MRFKLVYRMLFVSAVMLCAITKASNVETNPANKIDSIEKVLPSLPNDTLKLDLLYKLIGLLYDYESDKSLQYTKQLFEIADSMHYQSRIADAHTAYGVIYLSRKDFRNALLHHLKALRIYEARDSKGDIAKTYTNIGVVYFSLKRYDLANNYFNKALGICKQIGLKNYLLCNIYLNLGNIASIEKKTESAITLTREAYEAAEAINNTKGEYMALLNLGESYFDLGNYQLAGQYLHKAFQLIHDDLYNSGMCQYMLAGVAIEEGKYNEAEQLLFKALDDFKKGGIVEQRSDIYNRLSSLYDSQKKSAKAFYYYKLADSIEDEAINHYSVQQIAQLQKSYEVEKRDKEIQLLNQEQETMFAKAEGERITRNFVFILFALLLVLSFILFRNIVLKQRVKNRTLEEEKVRAQHANTKLLQENAEARYETLQSKTNPHFLFNSMATLTTVVRNDPDTAVEYIGRFSELYRAILKTEHQNLIPLSEEIQVTDHYLYLQKMRFKEKLQVNQRIEQESLNMYLPPFALQLVIENAIKHNSITRLRPLTLNIYTEENKLVVINNLQKKVQHPDGTATGQRSIMERYALLTNKKPEFQQTETSYVVSLPLLESAEISFSQSTFSTTHQLIPETQL
jgi:tetratricopeptide (TPR) repeat protein